MQLTSSFGADWCAVNQAERENHKLRRDVEDLKLRVEILEAKLKSVNGEEPTIKPFWDL